MTDIVPDGLQEVAEGVLDPDPSEWWVRDVTDSYPVTGIDRMYWIIDGEDRSVVLVQRGERIQRVSGRDGIQLLGPLLAPTAEGNSDPESLPRRLAALLIAWYDDPRGYVLDEAFFRKQAPVLDSWLAHSEQSVDELRRLRREAEWARHEGGWRLDFRAIDRHGGVADWDARGWTQPFTVTSVERMTVCPEGTFYFPDEL